MALRKADPPRILARGLFLQNLSVMQLGSVGVPEADTMRVMFPDPGDAEPPNFLPLPGQDSADAQALPPRCSLQRPSCTLPTRHSRTYSIYLYLYYCFTGMCMGYVYMQVKHVCHASSPTEPPNSLARAGQHSAYEGMPQPLIGCLPTVHVPAWHSCIHHARMP